MLLDHHRRRRKRGRGASGPAAPRAPVSVRRPPPAPSQPARAASTRILAALPRFPETPRALPHVPLWTRRAGAGGGDDDDGASLQLARGATGDVQRLVRHAHHARALLVDRLATVCLRRSHRCALAEELARLKKVLATTQAQVDASARDIAAMDRLVLHLQALSSIVDAGGSGCSDSAAAAAAVPAGEEGEEETPAVLPS